MINYDNLTSQTNDKPIQKLNGVNATLRRNEQVTLLRTAERVPSSSVFPQQVDRDVGMMLTAVRST